MVYVKQQKTVVERQCSDVPDQECKINTVVRDNPVNSTECKLEKENKCSIVTVPTKEKECRKILEKKCRTVSEIVTEIVEVLRNIARNTLEFNFSHALFPPGSGV